MCRFTSHVGSGLSPRRVLTVSTTPDAFCAVDMQMFGPAETVDGPRLEPKTTNTAAKVIAIIFNGVEDAAIRLL